MEQKQNELKDCCPKCRHKRIATERRLNGNSTCMNCGYTDVTPMFRTKAPGGYQPIDTGMIGKPPKTI